MPSRRRKDGNNKAILRRSKLRDGTTKRRRKVSKTSLKYERRAERVIQEQLLNEKLLNVAKQLKYYFDKNKPDVFTHVYETFFQENGGNYIFWRYYYNGDLKRMVQDNQNTLLEEILKRYVKDYSIEYDVDGQMFGENYYWDSITNQLKKPNKIQERQQLFNVAVELKSYFDSYSIEDLRWVFKEFFKKNKEQYVEWAEKYNGDLIQMISNNEDNEDLSESLNTKVMNYKSQIDVFSNKPVGSEKYDWDFIGQQLLKSPTIL